MNAARIRNFVAQLDHQPNLARLRHMLSKQQPGASAPPEVAKARPERRVEPSAAEPARRPPVLQGEHKGPLQLGRVAMHRLDLLA